MFVDNIDIKKDFQAHFLLHMGRENLMPFFYEIFIYGTAYIVGGYFRDFICNRKSRDIDIIVDITNETLLEIIKASKINYQQNRHGGIKLLLKNLEIDIWSIENNWAFKNNLVKLNEIDTLNSIAKGCFYNYDSPVINLHNFSYNLRYFKDFLETNKLNILQERSIYKNLNPTTEANILRAFYLKDILRITFTKNTFNYLNQKIRHLEDKYGVEYLNILVNIKSKYPKYNNLSIEKLKGYILDIKDDDFYNNQLVIDF